MIKYRPHFIGELEFIQPFIAENTLHIAFSKKTDGYLQKQTDFNDSLARLIATGDIEKILNKHGIFSSKDTLPSKPNKIQLTIGTVDNDEMLTMQAISSEFEQENPDIELIWQISKEGALRHRLLADLAISNGEFDIMTIGSYEAPIWAKRGWLHPFVNLPKNYDEGDLFNSVKTSLSHNNTLFALPFYTESSITYYRKDLFEKAKLSMVKNPTYRDIAYYASKLHNPKDEVYGICLRGKAGWGDNITFFTTMVNAYQGQWFDQQWHPQLDSLAWHNALTMYKNLLYDYGPPNPSLNGFNENKALFVNGHCAIWIDSTVAAGTLFDPKKFKQSAQVGLAPSPKELTATGSSWLWTWALAIPASSRHKIAAKKFVTWATSKAYIEKVAHQQGWLAVPPGTRKSTYQNKQYQLAAPFSPFVLTAIEQANMTISKKRLMNDQGIQFVGIPEFSALGHQVGLYLAMVIEGKISVNEALLQSQKLVDEQMKLSHYYQ